MLSLRCNDNDLSSLIPYDLKYIDYRSQGTLDRVGNFRWTYIENAYVDSLFLPFKFNGINVIQKVYCIPSSQHTDYRQYKQSAKEYIENNLQLIDDNEFLLMDIYTNDIEDFVSTLPNTDYIELDDQDVIDYLDKANLQLSARTGISTEYKVLKSTIKHMLILVMNYDDYQNKSMQLALYGLTPRIYEDYKEKFDENELAFFEELVHRSQLKRITNTYIRELFIAMYISDKYTNSLQDIKFNRALEQIINANKASLASAIDQAQRDAETALRNYTKAKETFYNSSNQLQEFMNNADGMLENYKNALKVDYVKDVSVDGNMIKFKINTVMDFYDTDALSCIIHNQTSKIQKFLNDVFIEGKYKVHVETQWRYYISNAESFSYHNDVSVSRLNEDNCMFNPHLYYFNCLGTYKPELANAQAKYDLIMFINLALASTRSINFSDGAVTGRWFHELVDSVENRYNHVVPIGNITCFEDKEGNMLSFDDITKEPEPEPIELDVVDTLEDSVEVEEMIDQELHEEHEEVEEEFEW